ncbi:hypothetical protein ACMG4J_22640 [Rossellomorea marisflavi]|uniref:hypothetical protein n=1 Tax=Rossellomorea marisflavi TaxID=189381 RepID=UPI0039BEF323
MKDDLPIGRLVFSNLDEKVLEWTYEQIQPVLFFWNEGYSLEEISEEIGRTQAEVALLIMSLEKENTVIIKPRPHGRDHQDPLNLPKYYIGELQKFYRNLKAHGGKYICFDFQQKKSVVDLFWEEAKVKAFINMWKEGRSLLAICAELNRETFDGALLAFDLGCEGLLNAR